MPRKNKSDRNGFAPSAKAFEKKIAEEPIAHFVLQLYVSGMTARSRMAIENIRNLCEQHLAGHYELNIIDIYQLPGLAKDAQVIAAPTLVKSLPLPLRKLIGNMGDEGRMMVVLGITGEGQE